MIPEPSPYDPDDPTDYDEATAELAYLAPDRGSLRDQLDLDDQLSY
jgi:hypothetical protein